MSENITIPCGKCNGKGEIKAYNHISGGICFACHGKGSFTYTLKQYEKKESKKRLKAENDLIQQEQRRKEYADMLYSFQESYNKHPEFIRCMSSCRNNEHYEAHLYNTMRFMKSRGMITD